MTVKLIEGNNDRLYLSADPLEIDKVMELCDGCLASGVLCGGMKRSGIASTTIDKNDNKMKETLKILSSHPIEG
jgi:hypothetical protein